MTGTVALNVCDLTRHAMIAPFLLGPVVPNRIVVKAEPGRIDGGALVLECEREQALAIVRVLDDACDRQRVPRVRMYVKGSRNGWKRVPLRKRKEDAP